MKVEKWNFEMAKKLLRMQSTSPQLAAMIKAALKKAQGQQVPVQYGHGKATPSAGRLYARGPSFQSLPGFARRLIAGEFYHDVDC